MLGVKDIRTLCTPVFERYPMVARAFVFGSYARGQQDEDSDVDICYDCVERGSADLPRGLAFFGRHGELRSELQRVLELPVDLLTTPEERSSSSRAQQRFAREVAKERRVIYERA